MLPIDLPLAPMLAKAADRIPAGQAYEPKWDGWRALLARDGDHVTIWSRHGTELTAYFPELVGAALLTLPDGCVLDGEIVIIDGEQLNYTKLSSRYGNSEKAQQLAEQWPATFVAFDVLAFGAHSLLDQPWQVRRSLLETLELEAPLVISPVTYDQAVAQQWFDIFEGAGLDGVVAKPLDGKYVPGQRAITKIKHRRTAEVVVGGYRLDRNSTPHNPQLGSLQLGLYDDTVLHWVGVCAGFPAAQRAELATTLSQLEPARGTPLWLDHPWSPKAAGRSGARVPEGIVSWSQPRDEVHLIAPVLVCEVQYDYLHDGVRFRSNTDFQRWRPDRLPESCQFDQLDDVPSFRLSDFLAR